ncbi:MAG: hypothetical protein J6386_11330 [Candidatus Synoicihabitans palmerolidicus]|nr:hypothetical protein [Candidatus Synoicihabitans palmerolidicus]
MIVSVFDSPHPLLRAAFSPGTLTDLYTSSTGKIFLGYLHRHRIGEIIERHVPPQRTTKSITTVEALETEADRVLATGFGVDDEEFTPGVRCLAAPVTGSHGRVVAAMGITAAAARFTESRIPESARHVKDSACSLSRLIGHH